MNKPNQLLKSSNEKCCCFNCNNPARFYLEAIHQVKSGFYCQQCRGDLMWHGLAKEQTNSDEDGTP